MTLQLDPPDRKSELVTSVYSGMALKLGKDTTPFGSHKYSEPQWHTPQLCGPGEYIEVKLPDNMTSPDEYNTFSLEPTSCQSSTTNWPPPSFIDSVAGKVRIANLSNDPCTIERNQHLCLARPTFSPDVSPYESTTPDPKLNTKDSKRSTTHYAAVNLDPDNTLSPEMKAQFKQTLDYIR